jgi:hypothetical protein
MGKGRGVCVCVFGGGVDGYYLIPHGISTPLSEAFSPPLRRP